MRERRRRLRIGFVSLTAGHKRLGKSIAPERRDGPARSACVSAAHPGDYGARCENPSIGAYATLIADQKSTFQSRISSAPCWPMNAASASVRSRRARSAIAACMAIAIGRRAADRAVSEQAPWPVRTLGPFARDGGVAATGTCGPSARPDHSAMHRSRGAVDGPDNGGRACIPMPCA